MKMDEYSRSYFVMRMLVFVLTWGFIFFIAGAALLGAGFALQDDDYIDDENYTDEEAMIVAGSVLLPLGAIVIAAGGFGCRKYLKGTKGTSRNVIVGGPTVTGTAPVGQVGSIQPYGQPYSQPFSQPQPHNQHYSQPFNQPYNQQQAYSNPQGYNSFSTPQPTASAPLPPAYSEAVKE